MATDAQRKAVYKYDDKFERVNCRLKKGKKECIEQAGYKSINTFIVSELMDNPEK